MMRTRAAIGFQSPNRGRLATVLGLSLISAVILVARTIRTAAQDGPLSSSELLGILLALIAAALAVAGAVSAIRGRRLAALLVGGAVVVELLLLDELAPPRLITAIPLFFALALIMVPARPDGTADMEDAWTVRSVSVVVALVLMVPIGIAYLATGLVAPMPDLLGVYALFAVLLTASVWLAVRRSWWVVAMPLLSVGVWGLMLWLGERVLDWSA